jgi:DNA-binding LacI/PurR family transcriptional regulator
MTKDKKPPTMKDVASLAGVSVQTVSVVINRNQGITQETRQRVLSAVEKLGYRRRSIARSLRTGKTNTVALVVSDIANPSFATMASAAENYAHALGYNLVVYNTHDDIEREVSYIHTAIERWVDGMLFVSAQDRMASLDELESAGIPTVAVDRIPEHYTGPSVTLDNVKAGGMAAKHLLDLGHTCIAHISGPQQLRLARERKNGLQQAIEARGLKPGPCIHVEGNWDCATGYRAMKLILEHRPHSTAVFSANDRMAIGAIRAIDEAGLRIPKDISILGLDDIEIAAFICPPLTTVRQSFAEMATLGMQLLLQILQKEVPDQLHILVEPELILRESTAPPPKE